MAKTLDFKDFMVVDYAPGMDPIIKRAAKKRKLDSGAGSNAEYSSTYAPGEQIDTIDENIGGLFKNASEWESSAKARGLVVKSMTHPSGETTKYQIAKDKQGNNRGHFDHGTKSGRLKEEADLDEEKDPRIERAGVQGFNKPKATPSHPEKSHIVVAKSGDQVKTIRFGEQGAETAGAPKEGESDRMKAKRKSFKARHAKNIAKGKMSAAYWADKVKW